MSGPYPSQMMPIPYVVLTDISPVASFEMDIDDAVEWMGIRVHRDVPLGLNYADESVGVDIAVDVSNDAGSTWGFAFGSSAGGGVIDASGKYLYLTNDTTGGATLTDPTPKLRVTFTGTGLVAAHPVALIGLFAASHDPAYAFLPHQ